VLPNGWQQVPPVQVAPLPEQQVVPAGHASPGCRQMFERQTPPRHSNPEQQSALPEQVASAPRQHLPLTQATPLQQSPFVEQVPPIGRQQIVLGLSGNSKSQSVGPPSWQHWSRVLQMRPRPRQIPPLGWQTQSPGLISSQFPSQHWFWPSSHR
jgi:hypothetical protein